MENIFGFVQNKLINGKGHKMQTEINKALNVLPLTSILKVVVTSDNKYKEI